VLAVLKLAEVERRLMLDIELQQLQQSASTSLAEQIQATASRIEALEAQNRELRLRLEDAQQKLAELANIERSIRERESDAN
jgi:predicted RNase H-like nuclease (RuvC/YqgF family)